MRRNLIYIFLFVCRRYNYTLVKTYLPVVSPYRSAYFALSPTSKHLCVVDQRRSVCSMDSFFFFDDVVLIPSPGRSADDSDILVDEEHDRVDNPQKGCVIL